MGETAFKEEPLSVLGEAAAYLAHEIKNPLGSIRLFVSLLRDEVGANGEATRFLSHIDKSVDMLDKVVSNMLQFSSPNLLKKAPCNLYSIVQECVEVASPHLGKSSLEIKLEGNGFIIGNDQALRQAILNVLLNAIEAVHSSNALGKVVIRGWEEGKSALVLQIKDNGPGISESVREKIFDPFFTLKKAGNGLGLAVVKKVIEAHRGSICVTSEEGACFTMSLPRYCVEREQL